MEPKTIEALRTLSRVLSEEGRQFVVIGAMVPQIVLDFRESDAAGSRETRDVDAVAEVASWEDFASLRDRLLQEGFRQGRVAHEFLWDTDVRIDLIPFGPALVEGDRLAWPNDGTLMNVCGLAEALECARDEKITDDLTLPVVTIPGSVLTKIIAYLDRPQARVRDLIDMVYYFEHYETKLGESRRFDLPETQVDGVPLKYEEAGAFLLGTEVAALAKPNSIAAVRQFVESISGEFVAPISQILAEEKRLVDNDARRSMLYRLFHAFGAGINQSQTR